MTYIRKRQEKAYKEKKKSKLDIMVIREYCFTAGNIPYLQYHQK